MSPFVDPTEYRRVIGLFATGVTVVVTRVDGEPRAMTANALTSVSLDPLLVLVCINKQLSMVEYIKQTQCFSISILREDQESLSNYFAHLWKEPTPPPHQFAQWDGGLRLEGCIAALGCALYGVYDGGDHEIVVARVMALCTCEEPYRPLLFYGGRYERLGAASPTAQS